MQVVRKLVEDATVQLAHSREEAAKAAEAQARAAKEWEAKQAQLKAAKGEQPAAGTSACPSLVLAGLDFDNFQSRPAQRLKGGRGGAGLPAA